MTSEFYGGISFYQYFHECDAARERENSRTHDFDYSTSRGVRVAIAIVLFVPRRADFPGA